MSRFELSIDSLVDKRTKIRMGLYKSQLKGESIVERLEPNIVDPFKSMEKEIRNNQDFMNRMSTALTIQKNMPVITAASKAIDDMQRNSHENMRAIRQLINTDYLSDIVSSINSYQRITADLTPELTAISSIDNNLINRIQSNSSIVQETLNSLNSNPLSSISNELKDMYNVSEMMSRTLIYQTSILTEEDFDDENIDIEKLKHMIILAAAKGYLYAYMFVLIYTSVTDTNLITLICAAFDDPLKRKSKEYIKRHREDEEDIV